MRDDGIRRFVVRHYRYDPARRERRHVVVAAFDNRREFNACFASVDAAIRNRCAAGERVEASEHASGIVREPGADRLAANGHLLRRAMEHGVDPRPWLDEMKLPPNIALLSNGDASGPGWLSRVGRLIRRWRSGSFEFTSGQGGGALTTSVSSSPRLKPAPGGSGQGRSAADRRGRRL